MNSEDTQPVIQEIIEYYASVKDAASQENLVALLREVQETAGCIPLDVQEDIASALSVSPAMIRQLIKLFPSLTSAPRRHKITVCTGPACSAGGAAPLLEAVRESIRDKPFLLTVKNCLKQCRTAPNLQIDNDFYANVKLHEIEDILKQYHH